MITTVFNNKGGVGKTSLSFNLAKDLGWFLLSNDDSVIEKLYPNKSKVLKDMDGVIDKNGADIIYDLGGYITTGLINILKGSDLVIVPTGFSIDEVNKTINTLREIEPYCKEIIIVVNKVRRKSFPKFQKSYDLFKQFNKPIYLMRESEAVINGGYMGKTIQEQMAVSPLAQNSYKGIWEDYEKILNAVKKGKENV